MIVMGVILQYVRCGGVTGMRNFAERGLILIGDVERNLVEAS
jgi:hypothetical protein